MYTYFISYTIGNCDMENTVVNLQDRISKHSDILKLEKNIGSDHYGSVKIIGFNLLDVK